MRVLAFLLLLAAVPAAVAAPERPVFDHLTTGFELIGQHRDLRCESCHANAMFKGTPKDCGSCHGVGTTIRATAKPADHILSTNQCAACHTPIAWKPAVNFDHTQARGSCSTCHNGTQAQGKPPSHIVTDLECDACHTTLTWAGAAFTHQGVTGNCASCHDGVRATGMPPTHIPIGAVPCEGCHSRTNFTTFAGTSINHASVTSLTCASCHETANFLGMHPSTSSTAGDSRPNATLDANHPKTGDCVQCHDTSSFGSSALRPANHIPTSAPCAQCHTTPGNYALYSVTGTHQGVTKCLTCHAPSVATTFANITIVSTPGNHIPIGTLDCNGSGCHTATNVNAGGFKLGSASIASPTLSVAGHTTVAAAVAACQTCHEAAPYMGMLPSSGTSAGDSRPSTTLDAKHPSSGDCSSCHSTTPTFASNVTGAGKPANHIPTSAPCTQCHTTAGNYALYSVTGTHQGVTQCSTCHGPTVATTFANITIVSTPGNHIPIGSLDCNGSGCHTATNVNAGGFKLGTASISAPTLSVAGHTTVAAAVAACQTCHEAAPYMGMLPSSATTAGDSRPTAFDKSHPTTGDCNGCHTTTPTFLTNQTGSSAKPANHIPTSAPCAQCHTTAGNYALYSVTGTHQGVTQCVTCHGPTVATTFANITIVSTPGNHIPIGSLDCNGSGCHGTTNVNAGGFRLGTANIASPTLGAAGHTTVAAAVAACQTCHEAAPYMGMLASSGTTAGDSRPSAALDAKHPTSGDCGSCHITTPTFASNVTGAGKPANHIPTTAPCAQCHTTAGNYALYSVTGTHQGVTGCLTCHGPTVATTFANVTIVSTPGNHIPIGTLDCNGSGCHTATNVNAGGFKLGSANIASPTLSVAGHATVVGVVGACQTCHESAPYLGMLPSTATAAADSRPTAFDKSHPTSGDCSGCHTTAPTFAANVVTGTKPANHIPTSAPCAQCHFSPGNFASYSVTGTHQGVTQCLTCHAPSVATTFANITIVSTPGNHFPIGTLDCNGSGCHTVTNVNTGGFKLGSANIASPTLSVAGHTTIAAAVTSCQTCHESAPYVGMLASIATTAGDSRPTALDKSHPTTGDCNGCHTTSPTFITNQTGSSTKPANHIPTTAACAQCHTTAGNYALYSVTGTHQGVTKCLTCHAPAVATTFANITIVSTPGNHFPIGTLDCNGSGCHTATNVNAGGFKLGSASIATPTLTVAGHTTIAAAVTSCQTCHESAPYVGMLASSATTAGDSRPSATLDKSHPSTGDCNGCHTTAPTFITNQTGSSTKPANHIPTTAACAQCHTTAGNYALYSVTGTHQGVTKCLTCHAPAVATTFANITIVSTPGNHIPIGTLDCNGSGCHTVTNVNAGGFKLGTANINTPTLNVPGHTTVATAVTSCQTCHQSAAFAGMVASTSTTAGDSRPSATLDKSHPTTGDCNGCHTTTPTFAKNQTGNAKPANHIPTTAACAQCHTTAGNYALYSVTGTHQGVTTCLTCHAPAVATTFANITIVSTPGNHIPIGTLDCNRSGCHTATNVNAGGFRIGAANLTTPTLTVAGHTSVATAVPSCQTCHQTAGFAGMVASTSTTAGDSRPSATLDSNHPASGDCNGCHTTTPTFSSNATSAGKPTNHIPTNAPCAQCHTTAGNYALYVMGATGHKGIASNCAQCHGYGLSFYNMAPPTLKQPASGATGHIPAVAPNGSAKIACELCHSAAVFTSFAGTVMKHSVVTSMKCMSCHEYGMKWQTNSGTRLWVRDSPNHHAGQDCGGSGCHSSRDKMAARVSHTPTPATAAGAGKAAVATTAVAGAGRPVRPNLTGGEPNAVGPGVLPGTESAGSFRHASIGATACVSCHTAASGGKPPGHISTSDSCQSCHTTLAWLPVRGVDHTQVRGSCASCHDGRTATGKPSRHLPTSNACESCHTSNAWTPARFDHGAVAPHTCTTCHNSVRAIGMPRVHIPTTQQCDVCHGTLAWKPAKVDHTGLVSGCATCHNNTAAVGQSPGHMNTRRDCSTCHAYPDWSAIRFRHTSAAYPGTHRTALACAACHTSDSDQVPYASPANAGTCAACHAKDYKPAAHPKTKGQNYAVSEVANCSGACHVYSETTPPTILRSLPGPHHRVSDATFKH